MNNEFNNNQMLGSNSTSNGNSSRSNSKKNEMKKVHSTPVWPTELPDVFSFPDTFFELQKDLDHCVLEYLIRMGYADAAHSFQNELNYQERVDVTGGLMDDEGEDSDDSDEFEDSDDEIEIEIEIDDRDDKFELQKEKMMQFFNEKTVFSNDYKKIEVAETSIKKEQSSLGLGTVNERKEIMMLLLNGKAKETNKIISEKWPFFFIDFPMIKLRLLHLEAIELIRDFFETDISGLKIEEIEEREKIFFDEFVNFIKVNLSDIDILKSSRFIKDMELTMGLLAYGRFQKRDSKSHDSMDKLPFELRELMDLSLRETIAIKVNKSLLTYVDGVTFTGELIEELESKGSDGIYFDNGKGEKPNKKKNFSSYSNPDGTGRYGVGSDDPNDKLLVESAENGSGRADVRILQRFNNGDSKLLSLVKLFVWSYSLNTDIGGEDSDSSRRRLEKMVMVTLGR